MTGGVFPIRRRPGGTHRSTGSWHRHHHRTHVRTIAGSGSDGSSKSSAGPYGLGWTRRSVPVSGLPEVCCGSYLGEYGMEVGPLQGTLTFLGMVVIVQPHLTYSNTVGISQQLGTSSHHLLREDSLHT